MEFHAIERESAGLTFEGFARGTWCVRVWIASER